MPAIDAEIVGDEHQRHAALLPQPHQQPQDLRLHRHVERRGRLVGDQQVGSQEIAMAIMTRWRCRPRTGAGSRRRGAWRIGMPTRAQQFDGALARLSAPEARCAGAACRRAALPTVITGLSEVIGSWNTIAMRRPRMSRICASGSFSRSCPR
jgi:hypothetical protein